MIHGYGVNAYAKTQTSAVTSQKQLIVLAYDGVIQFLRRAREHLGRGEIPEKIQCFEKARAVVEELAATLNLEKGGEIAANLWNLYIFFMRKITEANMTNDMAHVDGILPTLKTLRDAWAEMEVPLDDDAQALNRRMPAPEDDHRLSIAG
ncbi:MAG: flagellar export chaperone FliS [Deltaproteobacteria bacterium]|nr:flagellar export chaperone FliS [Deltaproteobacteria bacterium]